MAVPTPLTVQGDEPPPGTVDVIYDHLKDVAEKQFGDQSNLDGKMMQVFAVASVVMGLTGLSGAGAIKNIAVGVTLGLALLAYICVAVITGVEYRVKKFEALRFGSSLWEEEWDQPPEQVKLAVISRVKDAYDGNKRILEGKSALLGRGLIATAAEVVLVVAAVILRLTGAGA